MIYGQAGVPTKGWMIDEVINRGKGLEEACQCCEQRQVRYAHRITHPDYPEPFLVGCICAEALVQNYNGTAAQNAVVNRSKRRKNLLAKLKTASHPQLNGDSVKVVETGPSIFRSSVVRWGHYAITTPFESGPCLSRDLALMAVVEWAIP